MDGPIPINCQCHFGDSSPLKKYLVTSLGEAQFNQKICGLKNETNKSGH